MFPPRTIVAAVDFSDLSRAALNDAARLASQSGAALHVVHALDPLLETAARSRGVNLTDESSEQLSTFCASALDGDDRPVLQHVMVGSPVDVICALAKREAADVIVVGATGITGAERVIFGSTAEGVVRRAHTSVFVVRTGQTTGP